MRTFQIDPGVTAANLRSDMRQGSLIACCDLLLVDLRCVQANVSPALLSLPRTLVRSAVTNPCWQVVIRPCDRTAGRFKLEELWYGSNMHTSFYRAILHATTRAGRRFDVRDR